MQKTLKIFLLFVFYTSISSWQSLSHSENPPAPINVNATKGTYPDKIQITWDRVKGYQEIDYLVYRGEETSNPANMKLVHELFLSDNFFLDKEAVPGKRYYYRVKSALGSNIKSIFSEAAKGHLTDYASPPPDSTNMIKSPILNSDTLKISIDSIDRN